MIKAWTTKHYLIAASLLLVLTNVYVLAGVAYNRSGESVASLTLTERELSSPYSYSYRKEDSGVAFNLQWRVLAERKNLSSYGYYSGRYTPAAWLDKDKLMQLGFDTRHDPGSSKAYRYYSSQTARQVYLVLEYDGESYQRILKMAEENLLEKKSMMEKLFRDAPEQQKKRVENNLKSARNILEQEQNSRSRLFVIDAGLDVESLRQQYSDQSRYLVVKGKVKATVQHKNKQKFLRGRVSEVLNKRIHIPLPYSDQLYEYSKTKKYRKYQGKKPRFEASFAWGKRYEPWILAVNLLE